MRHFSPATQLCASLLSDTLPEEAANTPTQPLLLLPNLRCLKTESSVRISALNMPVLPSLACGCVGSGSLLQHTVKDRWSWVVNHSRDTKRLFTQLPAHLIFHLHCFISSTLKSNIDFFVWWCVWHNAVMSTGTAMRMKQNRVTCTWEQKNYHWCHKTMQTWRDCFYKGEIFTAKECWGQTALSISHLFHFSSYTGEDAWKLCQLQHLAAGSCSLTRDRESCVLRFPSRLGADAQTCRFKMLAGTECSPAS